MIETNHLSISSSKMSISYMVGRKPQKLPVVGFKWVQDTS